MATLKPRSPPACNAITVITFLSLASISRSGLNQSKGGVVASSKWFVRLGCVVAWLVASLVPPATVWAQGMSYPDSAAYVPPSSLVMVLVRPQAWVEYPNFSNINERLMPHEVVSAWGQLQLGIDPLSIAEFKFVVGMPIGDAAPPVGIVITTLADFDPANMADQFIRESGPIQVQQRTLYPLAIDGLPHQLYLDSIHPRTVLIADRLMLQAMRDAPTGMGPLAQLARENPPGSADVQALVALGPLRPIFTPVLSNLPADTPAELRELAAAGRLLNAIGLRGKQVGRNTHLRLEAIADDAAGASELLKLTRQGIELGKQQVLLSIQDQLANEEPGPVTDAWQAYSHRLLGELESMIQISQIDKRVVVSGSWSPSWAKTGFAAALILPAIEAARGASRRMRSLQNTKQILLALHEYHDTHGHLPPVAITADDGTPLLSWRVALLPFLGHDDLYQQFKRDEPWSSDHNSKLLNRIPDVFLEPDVRLSEARQRGLTAYHIPVGERALFQPTGTTSFSEVTDGLRSTAMLLVGNEYSLMAWTAPGNPPTDDSDNVWTYFFSVRPGFEGLILGMADGSVRMLSLDDLASDLIEALLTRAGGESLSDFGL